LTGCDNDVPSNLLLKYNTRLPACILLHDNECYHGQPLLRDREYESRVPLLAIEVVTDTEVEGKTICYNEP